MCKFLLSPFPIIQWEKFSIAIIPFVQEVSNRSRNTLLVINIFSARPFPFLQGQLFTTVSKPLIYINTEKVKENREFVIEFIARSAISDFKSRSTILGKELETRALSVSGSLFSCYAEINTSHVCMFVVCPRNAPESRRNRSQCNSGLCVDREKWTGYVT